MSELEKKIINILYLSGQEISVSNIVEILKITESEGDKSIIESFENIKDNLNKIGLMVIKREEFKNGNLNQVYLSINTNPQYAELLNSFANFETASDLTPAQLQTLTIVSYLKQASTQEISFIRGIQSVQTLRALSTRGLVKKIGDKYTLTTESLQNLGIEKVEDLKDFEKLNANLISKLADALNG